MKFADTKPRRFSSMDTAPAAAKRSTPKDVMRNNRQSKIFDDPAVVQGYESVPLIDIDVLPRGGISLETQAIGRIQVRQSSQNCIPHISFRIETQLVVSSIFFSLEFPQKRSKIVCY